MSIEIKPLPIALFLIFVTLKLCGILEWPWWWVTAPLWGAILLALVLTWAFKPRTPEQKIRALLKRIEHGE